MIYEVKFTHGEQPLFVSADSTFLPADKVVVQLARAQFSGVVMREISETLEVSGQILRAVTALDEEQAQKMGAASRGAKQQIRALVADSGLAMSIETATYSLDGALLFITFTADKRVDFRQLLRALTETFRMRIELRQIGVRDAAKLIGGLGPCGRPLCCSEFLYEFPAVSIKMLKNQQLSMNQAKNNGLCGRLKCCLTYEDDFYKEASRDFPDFGDWLVTEEGRGKVIGMNILARTVKLRHEEFVREYSLDELHTQTTNA
ncbi:MAG: Signal peptidase [Streptococcaceae bacterium]|jgi:cell fate regulator YaaT (PSP1 superfamily)|nr:Signal peptidase [Streptococcaceae bacterium]